MGFEKYKGKVIKSYAMLRHNHTYKGLFKLIFTDDTYLQFHCTSKCCGWASLEETHGDLSTWVGAEIITISKLSSQDLATPFGIGVDYSEYNWCHEWSFFKVCTNAGDVELRFLGGGCGTGRCRAEVKCWDYHNNLIE